MPKTSKQPAATMLRIVSRVWDAAGPTPAVAAQHILSIRLPDEDQARMHELAARSGTGEITAAELAEYDEYLLACGVFSILRSHARMALGIKPPAKTGDD